MGSRFTSAAAFSALLRYRLFALASMSGLGLRFMQNIVLARLAGAEAYGIYLALLVVPLIAVRLLDLSVPQALTYYVRRDHGLLSQGGRVVVLHSIAMAPLMLAVALGQSLLPTESPAIQAAMAEANIIVAIVMLVTSISTGIVTLMLAIEHFSYYALLTMLSPIAMSAGVLLMHLYGQPVSPAAMLRLMAVIEAGVAAIAVILLLLAARGRRATQPVSFAALYAFGLRAHPGVALKVIGTRLDRLILLILLQPAALSIYTVALNVRDMLVQPVNMYSVILTNKLTDRSEDLNAVVGLLMRNIKLVSALLALGILPLALIAPWLFGTLFGPTFSDASLLFAIMAPSAIFSTGSGFAWGMFYAVKRPDLVSKSIIASSPAGFILLYLLAQRYDALGAAFAVLASSLATAAAVAFCSAKLIREMRKTEASQCAH